MHFHVSFAVNLKLKVLKTLIVICIIISDRFVDLQIKQFGGAYWPNIEKMLVKYKKREEDMQVRYMLPQRAKVL